MISVPIFRRVVPAHLAAAFLTGEPFDAESPAHVGLVTHVTDDVTAVVDHLCAAIAAGAPSAVAATKRMLREAVDPGRRAREAPRSPGCGRSPTSTSRAPRPPRAWPPSPRSARPSWQLRDPGTPAQLGDGDVRCTRCCPTDRRHSSARLFADARVNAATCAGSPARRRRCRPRRRARGSPHRRAARTNRERRPGRSVR